MTRAAAIRGQRLCCERYNTRPCLNITPIPLKMCRVAFDDPNWLFEVKHEGFRALAYIEHGPLSVVSRNGFRFSEFLLTLHTYCRCSIDPDTDARA